MVPPENNLGQLCMSWTCTDEAGLFCSEETMLPVNSTELHVVVSLRDYSLSSKALKIRLHKYSFQESC